tara:strand:+ start:59 stop:676 length:618 start_codon:yes stop_codon:yes gene_type:complete
MLSFVTLPTAVVPRAPPPTMTSLFNGRGFFVRAVAVGNSGLALPEFSQPETITPLRHAELKHARLAMLAAIALPAQEYLHPRICSLLECRDLLTNGMSPNGMNGGIFSPDVAPALALALVVFSAAELLDISSRSGTGLAFNEWSPDSVAGDLGFDPLNIARDLPATEKFELQEAEMLNGRIAMLALATFAIWEMTTGSPVSAIAF